MQVRVNNCLTAQLAGTIEYTDCILAEELKPCPNKCLGYDIKPSDSKAPALEI